MLANVFQPGAGIDMSTLGTVDISKYAATAAEVTHEHAFIETILNLIPSNIFAAMARGEMLPIIFFSVLFGLGLSSLNAELRDPLVKTFQGVSESMFKVTHMIMNYAPIGVFALIAVTVANFGFASLVPLAKLVLLVYGAILFFAVAVLGLIAKLFGFSVFKLIRIFKDELVLAYSTASSETVLPRVIEKMEAYGCPKAICSFVVPTGYSFNLDGSTLYQSIAAIFIAQLYGEEQDGAVNQQHQLGQGHQRGETEVGDSHGDQCKHTDWRVVHDHVSDFEHRLGHPPRQSTAASRADDGQIGRASCRERV